MIILKLTDVFEIHAHFKMVILKLEQFLNYVIQRIARSFTFKYFQKTEVYLEPIQTSKMELFVKIVNILRPLTILTKSSILDLCLCSKNATKSFNKASASSTFLTFAAVWLNTFFPFGL